MELQWITNSCTYSSHKIPVTNSAEYHPSQYISDFFRKRGFGGIKYHSMNSQGKCYTFFNCADNYIKFVDSQIVLARSPIYYLYNMNDGTPIMPSESLNTFCILSKVNFNKMRGDLYKCLEERKNGPHDL